MECVAHARGAGCVAGDCSNITVACGEVRLLILGTSLFRPFSSADPASCTRYMALESFGLTNLTDGVFAGLSNLLHLGLSNNQLTTLPAGVFFGLSSLQYLTLDSNQLTTLPAGVFSGLSSLKQLLLDSNNLTLVNGSFLTTSVNLRVLSLDSDAVMCLPPDLPLAALSLLRVCDRPDGESNQMCLWGSDRFANASLCSGLRAGPSHSFPSVCLRAEGMPCADDASTSSAPWPSLALHSSTSPPPPPSLTGPPAPPTPLAYPHSLTHARPAVHGLPAS